MAIQKVLARGWTIEVEDLGMPLTYIPVNGINTIGFEDDDTKTDTTDFNSAGANEHLVAERVTTMTLEGFHLEDPATGDRDPGQEMVEQVAKMTGNNSLGNFKVTSPGGKIKKFLASAKVSSGGSHNEAMSWQVELQVSGKPTEETGA